MRKVAWESCRKAATDSKSFSLYDLWSGSDNNKAFQEWNAKSVEDQMLLMAAFAPNCAGPDVAQHIVDAWKKTAPPKSAKKIFTDADGYEVVNRKGRRDDDDDDDENETKKGVPQEDAEDFEFFDVDPDIKEEISRRGLDIAAWDELDDDDVVLDSRHLSDAHIVRELVQRGINFVIPKTLLDEITRRTKSDPKFLTLKEKEAVVKCFATLLKLDANADIAKYTKKYRTNAKISMGYEAKVDSSVLRSAAAIGMTTSGAAKYNR